MTTPTACRVTPRAGLRACERRPVAFRSAPSHANAQWPVAERVLAYRCGGSSGIAGTRIARGPAHRIPVSTAGRAGGHLGCGHASRWRVAWGTCRAFRLAWSGQGGAPLAPRDDTDIGAAVPRIVGRTAREAAQLAPHAPRQAGSVAGHCDTHRSLAHRCASIGASLSRRLRTARPSPAQLAPRAGKPTAMRAVGQPTAAPAADRACPAIASRVPTAA